MKRAPHARALLILLPLSLVFGGTCFADNSLPFEGEVIGEGINVRIDSTTSSQTLCSLNKGERVEVVSELYEWYKIKLPKSLPVYLRADMAVCIDNPCPSVVTPKLSAETAQQFPPQGPCRNAKIIKDRVNIRFMPEASAPVITQVRENQIVQVLKEEKGWYQIARPDNSYGWVHKKFIRKAASATELKVSDSAQNLGRGGFETRPYIHPDGSVVLSGRLLPYGMVFRRRATHKLITEEGKVYLLKGKKEALDALVQRKVKITGKDITPQESRYPVIEIGSIEVAE